MTDLASIPSLEPLLAPSSRRDAFRAAGRHTARVRLLRILIVVSSVVGVAGLVGYAFFNPFRSATHSVTIENVGLNGTKVTMDQPRMTGFKSDGRPYSLNAKTAVQDARSPNILELHEIDAHVTMADKSVVHVVSSLGTYDSSKETMSFDHDVHLTSDAGFDAVMKNAYVEFKNGVVDTREPLTVVMPNGTVAADTMHMSDNGKAVSFEGHVHSVVRPPAASAAPPPAVGIPAGDRKASTP